MIRVQRRADLIGRPSTRGLDTDPDPGVTRLLQAGLRKVAEVDPDASTRADKLGDLDLKHLLPEG